MINQNFPINELRNTVFSGKTRDEPWRRQQLAKIEKLIGNHEEEIKNTLFNDLGKPPTEAFFELIAISQELRLAQKNLKLWMRQRKVQVPLSLKPGEAKVLLEPLGCVLIIGPWNYPFSLVFQPLVSALAAGNTAVLKPSEHAPNTSKLIARLVSKYFNKDVVHVVEGDGSIASSLLEYPFDHVFFTGGGETGRKVMAAAAKNLIPITLELGGKSPAIVIAGADLKVTARRLIWGKGINAGQTCIAPDHLIIQEQLKAPLLREMRSAIKSFYGINPVHSDHLGQIINSYHFNRLIELLQTAKSSNRILLGGEVNESLRKIAPTLIEVIDQQDPLMDSELFGPLLPIIQVSTFEESIARIKQQPKPLAIYMFGGTTLEQEKLLKTTSSGGVCFNDVILQAGVPELPFGGVGASGIGLYHGQAGFETFSHQKSVFKRPFFLDLKFRYPPYNVDLSLLKRLIK